MPLSDSSKSKVSLSSISATTAAAAESLWSRSKKSLKRKSNSPPETESATISEGPSVTTATTTSKSNADLAQTHPNLQLRHQPLDRQEFRRRFLEGLQFYCENSSLILNSDLPADLIEFVTSHGSSVESLGIILELKKSSSAFTSVVDKKAVANSSAVIGVPSTVDKQAGAEEQKFSEVSRRLLQHWMNADSCAEAFVSLSLGEEIPGLIAESASFQRVLFAIPDNFRIAGKDFVNFIVSQVILSINALAYGIRSSTSEGPHIRTQTLASVIDRLYTRYFSDGEYFYNALTKEDEEDSFEDNPFLRLISQLVTVCDADVIVRRLVSKIFLRISSHPAYKLAKTIFCYSNSERKCPASIILYPATEFLETSGQWRHILESFPVKVVTKSKRFWINWATFIQKESKHCDQFWRKCVDHWIVLNKSSLVDEHSLYSATLAVVALSRQIKIIVTQEKEDKPIDLAAKVNPNSVFENLIHSLETTNESKKYCGMALADVVSDLRKTLLESLSDPDVPNPTTFGDICKSSVVFSEIIDFYMNGIKTKTKMKESLNEVFGHTSNTAQRIQVLDSDDDEAVNIQDIQEDVSDDFYFRTLNDNQEMPDVGTDSRLLMLRNRNIKLPMYFSEIVELLLESRKDEDEAEILKIFVILKIPVLLLTGVKIDSKMCITLCRCLVDTEDKPTLKLSTPIVLALYELFLQYPFEAADVVADVVFDENRYTVGQRALNLNRLLQIVQLSSKQSCFNCYAESVRSMEKEVLGIYPEFIQKYYTARRRLRFCQTCKDMGNTMIQNESQESTHCEEAESLTWRQIVDRRVAAKTKYFITPKSKAIITVPDEYSSKLIPIVWASVANRLTFHASYYLDNEQRIKSGKMYDFFLINIFQYLGKCMLGSSGPNCPHIGNLAKHAGELVTNFIKHEDEKVRHSVLNLLAITLCMGDGKIFVLEALSSKTNLLRDIDYLHNTEKDKENLKLLAQIQQYVAGCTAAGMLQNALNLDSE